MSDDLRQRLEEAGSSPVTGPDPAFADALAARLHAVAATLPPSPTPEPRRRAFTFGWRAAGASLALAATAVIVILGVSSPGPRRETTPVPTLAGPVHVEVALADGTVLEDPDGMLLPDGAVITVYEGGTARIGDATLFPGDVATVRDGRLDVERPPTGVLATPAGPATIPPASTPSSMPASPSASPSRTSSPPPSGPPAPSPGATVLPTAQPGTTLGPASAAPTATAAPFIVRPRLRARLLDGPRIAVTWTATVRARSYVLVVTRSRSGPARDPVYPGSRVLGEFATPPATPIRFQVPDGIVEMRLMVVALRADGSVLRRSNIVTVMIPAPGDATGAGSESSPMPVASQQPGPTAAATVMPGPTTTPAASASPGP